MKPDPKAHESRMAELRARLDGSVSAGRYEDVIDEALAHADEMHSLGAATLEMAERLAKELQQERAARQAAERERDEISDRLDHERLDHDHTRGYRSQAELDRESLKEKLQAAARVIAYALAEADETEVCPLGLNCRDDGTHDPDCPLVVNGFVTAEGERKDSLATTGGGREGGAGG